MLYWKPMSTPDCSAEEEEEEEEGGGGGGGGEEEEIRLKLLETESKLANNKQPVSDGSSPLCIYNKSR